MKKYLLSAFSVLCLLRPSVAQTYLPIVTSGYNLDAVAENTTALSTTGAAIDGSNYILYSVAYGLIVGGGSTYGLPNNGLIASGTRTYQLQPYTANNMLYLPALQADTILITTPAQYPSISLCAFATEGTGIMTIKLRFTDGSSQTFSSITLDDWFSGTATNFIITGLDRANRTSGTPNYNGTNPRMYKIDLNLSCANRLKNLQKVIVQNTSTNPRLCIMAVSGGISATYSVNTSPVTCLGGTNGSASITVNNGVPPFTYSWSTMPVQTSALANLPAGISTYTVTDASACDYTASVNIPQAIVASPPLIISPSQNPVCSGSSLTLSTTGAVTYTWSNNGSSNTTTVSLNATTLYSVVATTSANCTLTGNITVTTTPLPVLSFTSVPAKLCITSQGVPLTANPPGGTFGGPGISFGTFFPSLAGVGTQAIYYSYTDLNNCTSTTTISTTIATNTIVVAFAISPSSLCYNGPNIALNGTPAGGTYSVSPGSGIVGAVFSPSLAGVGAYNITYSYSDANNCSGSKATSVFVSICSFTGVKELSKDRDFYLYPNPNNGSFNISGDSELDLDLINNIGQSIRHIKLDAGNGYKIFVENLSDGIYFLTSTDRQLNRKIIVTR